MESVVLASTLPKKMVPEEIKPQAGDEVDGGEVQDGAGTGDGIEECAEGEENGNDPASENKKKEIVFDNDEIIKKAFQGEKDKDFPPEYIFCQSSSTMSMQAILVFWIVSYPFDNRKLQKNYCLKCILENISQALTEMETVSFLGTSSGLS